MCVLVKEKVLDYEMPEMRKQKSDEVGDCRDFARGKAEVSLPQGAYLLCGREVPEENS
jgi:hypothetical protein